MKSKIITLIFIAAAVISAFSQEDPPLQGKDIFYKYNCFLCHTISIQKIYSRNKKAIDLSQRFDVEEPGFLAKWLKQEFLLNGKTHILRFPGSDEELDCLSNWLISNLDKNSKTLKTKPKVNK